MGENTAISWADHTFNPWIGCMKVSPACDGCYAEAQMGAGGRSPRAAWGGPGLGVGTRTRTKDWSKPHKWNREAAAAPGATFVFCASLSDVFDNAVPAQWRADLFDLIRATPNLTWLLLTKRPQNIIRFHELVAGYGADPRQRWLWPPNAALGCTLASQAEAERDLPWLLVSGQILKPAFLFVSLEPLLGAVDLTCVKHQALDSHYDALRGTQVGGAGVADQLDGPTVGWVITGGETDQRGHKARPAHPDWFRSLRDQCARAEVPFHHKQHGEWAPICWMDEELTDAVYHPAPRRDPEATRRCKVDATVMHADGSLHPDPADRQAFAAGSGAMTMFKVGKKRSGRAIDGVVHNARPEVRR